MNFQSSGRTISAISEKADIRPLRLAALGDGVIGPLSSMRRGASGPECAFIDQRFPIWLGMLLPGVEASENAIVGAPGEFATEIAARANALLDLHPLPDAVLICAGAEDCAAAVRGVAPDADDAARAFRDMADLFAARGVKPIFIIPPPNALFSNGLFADRYVTLASTLRRLCRVATGPALIDPIPDLLKPRARGIEPDPRYASEAGLTSLGAFRLAQTVAARLRALFPHFDLDGADDANSDAALNANPFLDEPGGEVASVVVGACAAGYRIDGHGLGDAAIRASVERSLGRSGQRISFSGSYSTGWGFARLHQRAPMEAIMSLARGDEIEAVCDFELVGPVENIASVSLHATPVWNGGFIGLHSSSYAGGPGVAEPHRGRLRTPRFTLPRELTALNLSLQAHLVPGADRNVSGELLVQSLMVRKAAPSAVGTADQTTRQLKRRRA
ncbi:hypothetical protein [Terrarubrum flagellatum]|uniref:hypothetical protein n=1 Tax=Terrirubrum flagellatum TaxID=2895980 RepID=UPI003144FB0E